MPESFSFENNNTNNENIEENSEKDLENSTLSETENSENLEFLESQEWEELIEDLEKKPMNKIFERMKEIVKNPRVHAALAAVSLLGSAQAQAQEANYHMFELPAGSQVDIRSEHMEGQKFQVACAALDFLTVIDPRFVAVSDAFIGASNTYKHASYQGVMRVPVTEERFEDRLVSTETVYVGDYYREVTQDAQGNPSSRTEGSGSQFMEITYYFDLDAKKYDSIRVTVNGVFSQEDLGCYFVQLDENETPLSVEEVFSIVGQGHEIGSYSSRSGGSQSSGGGQGGLHQAPPPGTIGDF